MAGLESMVRPTDSSPLIVNADACDLYAPETSAKSSKYYFRLCTLIIREGTRCLRNYTNANLGNREPLPELLKYDSVKNIFRQLYKRRGILPQHYKVLFPEDGSDLNEDEIDISLWVILARNLTQHRDLINWDKVPEDGDDLKPHHMLRIRNARNRLSHLSKNEFSRHDFETAWTDICNSLVALGSSREELQRLKSEDLDPEMVKIYAYEVKQQALDEKCSRLEKDVKQRQCLLCGFIAMLILSILSFAVIIGIVIVFTKETSCRKYITNVRTQEAWMQFMSRAGWGAQTPQKENMIRFIGPVDYLIVSHTAISGNCRTHEDCCQRVKFVQELNMHKDPNQHFADIAFSYLIGGDGVAYEGRGTFFIPATVPKMNHHSLSIAFIGLFTDQTPTQDALDAAKIFIQYLVDTGALSKNTTVLGLCQVYGSKYPRSPGINIMKKMQNWHGHGWAWKPINVTDCEGMEDYIIEDNQ